MKRLLCILCFIAIPLFASDFVAAIKTDDPKSGNESTTIEPSEKTASEPVEEKPAPDKPAESAATKPAPRQIEQLTNLKGPIFVAPLKGEVSPAQFYFLRRSLKEAERAGASAFIVEIDTFGGRVDSAMEQMDALMKTKIPTYAFINTKAISAGALVSLATNKIYMHPDSVIGAAAVVSGNGEDLQKSMQDKASSMVSAKARGAATKNGHNPDIAEAFIVKEAEVKVGDSMVDTKEKLLSLSAGEAVRMYDGKPLLAIGTVDSVETLIKEAGLTGQLRTMQPTGFEQIAFWLTTIAPLLLMGGIVCGYIEFKTPGFGIFGIIAAVCFTLFFASNFIAGLAGWEVAIVFVIGAALVIGEIFIHPGTIIPGLIGALLMICALIWGMVDYWPGSPDLSSSDFETPMLNFVIAIAGSAAAAMFLAKVLPKTSMYNRLVLSGVVADGPAVSVPMVNMTVQNGEIGVAKSTLRPAGKAEFNGEIYDVVTPGGYIEAGEKVCVVSSDGVRVVVEAVRG